MIEPALLSEWFIPALTAIALGLTLGPVYTASKLTPTFESLQSSELSLFCGTAVSAALRNYQFDTVASSQPFLGHFVTALSIIFPVITLLGFFFHSRNRELIKLHLSSGTDGKDNNFAPTPTVLSQAPVTTLLLRWFGIAQCGYSLYFAANRLL